MAHRNVKRMKAIGAPTSCIQTLAWWEKKSLTRHGATLGGRLDMSIKKKNPPTPPSPTPPADAPGASPKIPSIHLPCSPRANPDVSLVGWIRSQERVHSVVTSTRCAPLTQNTQPVDMPHRHHTDPPQSVTHLFPFTLRPGSSARPSALTTCLFSLSSSVFLPPPLSLFFLSVKLISKVFTLGANKKPEQIYSLEHGG